jgi:hypothetical protein
MVRGFTQLVTASLCLFQGTASAPVILAEDGPIIHLQTGSYRGLFNRQTDIESFRGIRFAQPPLGELRFKAPIALPASTNDAVMDATSPGLACVQAVSIKEAKMRCMFCSADCDLFSPFPTPFQAILCRLK